MSDIFKTIAEPSEEILIKEKNSKFYGCAFPIVSEQEVKPIINVLQKKYPNAGHFCYAFKLGSDQVLYRTNDDGEPNNSAGHPIYGQIQSFELTNILVVVVRVFGGSKLGIGGLISAYKTAAHAALEASEIVEKTIDILYTISFDYKNINKVMRIVKENKLEIVSQIMNQDCILEVSTRKKNTEKIVGIFENLFEIELKIKV